MILLGIILALLGSAEAAELPQEPAATVETPPEVSSALQQLSNEATGAQTEDGSDRRLPGAQTKESQLEPTEDPNKHSGLLPIKAIDPGQMPRTTAVEDRWRLPLDLGLVNERWFDPYNVNILKGDRPIIGREWFFSFGLISDTNLEPRRLPPLRKAGSTPAGDQFALIQNIILPLSFYKGDTVFRPPDFEFRITPVFNFNHTEADARGVLNIDPGKGGSRNDYAIGIQQLSLDMALRTVSPRFDFDRLRIGVQPFTADFRGFLFLDNALGVRLYGNRANNVWQYNLAWFRRTDKDTNSGLNDASENLRQDDVFIANVYRQDFPRQGFNSQLVAAYNRNREGNDAPALDDNGFQARPSRLGLGQKRNYDVGYLGYNGDGHLGRLNLSVAAYLAVGSESSGTFSAGGSDIFAGFGAAEASMDFDWIRVRFSALYGSGDSNPRDHIATGFDAIAENPVFAGGDTSYWIRQALPFGQGLRLTGRNGILNSLRSSKEQGQSNFTNPGIQLVGLGADFDVLPELRVSTNLNKLYFDTTAPLEAARQISNIHSDIGWDLSAAVIYRPAFTQNAVLRISGALLVPGDGFQDLYGDALAYSVLANLILTY